MNNRQENITRSHVKERYLDEDVELGGDAWGKCLIFCPVSIYGSNFTPVAFPSIVPSRMSATSLRPYMVLLFLHTSK